MEEYTRPKRGEDGNQEVVDMNGPGGLPGTSWDPRGHGGVTNRISRLVWYSEEVNLRDPVTGSRSRSSVSGRLIE